MAVPPHGQAQDGKPCHFLCGPGSSDMESDMAGVSALIHGEHQSLGYPVLLLQ